ncbi:hypothetical protein [Profundibacter sp.]
MNTRILQCAVIFAAFSLSGCVSTEPVLAPLPQRIIPASEGLKIADSGGQEISFGRAQLGVETAINRLVGASLIDGGTNAQGCEFRTWENGLKLVFKNGEFAGWIAGPPVWKNPVTSAGNSCGWLF